MDPESDFEERLVSHLPHLRRIVQRIAKEEGVVDDIVQECCLRIIEKEKLWSGDPSTLNQWMNMVSRNLTFNILNKKKKERQQSELFEDESHVATIDREENFSEENIKWAIKQFPHLTAIQQTVMQKRYIHGMKVVEIADELQVSKQTVSEHIQKALQILKKRARSEGLLGIMAPGFWSIKNGFKGLALAVIMKNKAAFGILVLLVLIPVSWMMLEPNPIDPAQENHEMLSIDNSEGPENKVVHTVTSSQSGEAGNDEVEDKEKTQILSDSLAAIYKLEVDVKNQEGQPVEADVILEKEWQPAKNQKTDLQGRATFELQADGFYLAKVSHQGTIFQQEINLSPENPIQKIEVTVGLLTLSGQLISKQEAHSGVSKVWGEDPLTIDLIKLNDQGEAVQDFKTDPKEGQYLFSGLEPGNYRLQVPKKFIFEEITISENTQKDIVFPSGRIEGSVTDKATGKPLTGVQVVLQPKQMAGKHRQAMINQRNTPFTDRLAPDKNGYYFFENLPVGEYLMFSNGESWGRQSRTVVLTSDHDHKRVNFELNQGSFINLSVVDINDQPIERFRITLAGMSWGFAGERISGLSPGSHRPQVFAPGYALFFGPELHFKPGEITDCPVVMEKAVPTNLIVRDGNSGQVVPGAVVSIFNQGFEVQSLTQNAYRNAKIPLTLTDHQGHVRVLALKPGQYPLVIRKSGFEVLRASLAIKEGQGQVEVSLKPGDTLFERRVQVSAVVPNGVAASLDFQTGDYLLAVDDIEVDNVKEFLSLRTQQTASKGYCQVTVERQGQKHTVNAPSGLLGLQLGDALYQVR